MWIIDDGCAPVKSSRWHRRIRLKEVGLSSQNQTYTVFSEMTVEGTSYPKVGGIYGPHQPSSLEDILRSAPSTPKQLYYDSVDDLGGLNPYGSTMIHKP